MIKELLEKRAVSANYMVELRDKIKDEKRAFTEEERVAFDKASADYDKLSQEIEDIKRANDVQKEMESRVGREDVDKRDKDSKSDVNENDRQLAFRGWMRHQLTGIVNDNERQAIEKVKLNPNAKELEVRLGKVPHSKAECRDLNVATPADGGYTVPEGFVNNLEEALLFFGTIRETSEVIRTNMGNDLPWPTVNDTTNEGVLVAEAGAIASDADPTFDEVIFQAFKYTSKIIKVSAELLEDSAFDLPSYLGRAIGERLGRAMNTVCTVGDGTAKPNGIVTASTNLDTAGSGVLASDDFISLIYGLDSAYAQGAGFIMNRAIMGLVRKFKDGNDQYLWQPSYADGQPERLLSYPVFQNSAMDATATAGDVVAVFGQLNKYKIREVNSIRLKRLVELYAENDQEGFGGFMRFDGDLLDAGTNPVHKLTIKA